MFTLALTMCLKPGCLEKYRLAHEKLWPEIARSMSANEVSMAIYHEAGRLFIFATAPSEAHWKCSRQEPALERWDAAMTEFLEAAEPGKIAFSQPQKVFGFGDFA
ncbi:MAG: L-rhamnose mutarotase [Verrucomicrobiota bacterium]|nr:L-rhamnose mutarotase [Verrucomicrobiota bacterium]